MKTDFFKHLHAAMDGTPAVMTITPEGSSLVISFLPGKTGDKKSKLVPLNMNGTPEEFDEEFLSSILKAVQTLKSGGLVTNQEEFEASVAEEDKNDTPSQKAKGPAPKKGSPVAKKSAPAKKAAVKTPEVKKPAPKAAPAKAQKPKEEIQDPPAQLDLVKEAEKVIPEPPQPPPAPPKHTDEDLATFKGLLEKEKGNSIDEVYMIKKALERGSSAFSKEQLNDSLASENAKLMRLDVLLKKIEDGSYGIRNGALVPREVLLQYPSSC